MRPANRALAAGIALLLFAAACGGGDDPAASTPGSSSSGAPPSSTTPPPPSSTSPPPTAGELVRSDVERLTETDVTGQEIRALVGGNTAFALALFELAARDGANTIVSPYSIAAALTMTYAGARGTTAAEMRDVLELALGDDRIHAARNELDLLLAGSAQSPEGEVQPFAIRVANSLWGQQGYPFLEQFLDLLAENYDAGMNIVDFTTAAEETRRTINAWVEDRTEGRIVDLIPEGVITDLTRLVLVNAIWFKANWRLPFDPELTGDGTFTTLADEEVTVPMMQDSLRVDYAAGDGYAAVRLPYAGDASMLVIVPDRGRFEEVARSLDPALLEEISSGLSDHLVQLSLPRFEFRTELPLKPVLQELGMVEAFMAPAGDGGADLTGMTSIRELYVQDALHQAFISVDEQGTEAAAATALVVGVTSMPPAAELAADRPFLFLIRQDSTGEIIFAGQVTDPS